MVSQENLDAAAAMLETGFARMHARIEAEEQADATGGLALIGEDQPHQSLGSQQSQTDGYLPQDQHVMKPQLSLADLVQRQAQQIYYQAQTNEKFHERRRQRSNESSRGFATQYEPKAVVSARFEPPQEQDTKVSESGTFHVQGRHGKFSRDGSTGRNTVLTRGEGQGAGRNLPSVTTGEVSGSTRPFQSTGRKFGLAAEIRSQSVLAR